jgi:hypothetical protein
MTDATIAAMHALLAAYHRKRAREATLDVVQQYHVDLAQRLSDEAAWKTSLNTSSNTLSTYDVLEPQRDAVT